MSNSPTFSKRPGARATAPAIALVAYEAWPNGRVFVRVPGEAGRYILTDRCVIKVVCPCCKAAKGEPCFNPYTGRYWVGTHGSRRTAAPDRWQPRKDKPLLRAKDIDHNGEPK